MAKKTTEPPKPPPDDPLRRQQWEQIDRGEGDVSPADAARSRKKALEQMKKMGEEQKQAVRGSDPSSEDESWPRKK